MPSPVRYPSGFTTDQRFGPLSGYGFRNPFFWHEWEDDFDGMNAIYTKTTTGNGTAVGSAAAGGVAVFTTNSSTPVLTDIAAIQLPFATFKVTKGKKAAFLIRLQLADAINSAFNVGLIQTTTTPFTVVDGIYFNKATGSAANLKLNSAVASAITSTTIPTGAYTLANATNIDLGFFLTTNGDILAYVGSQLVGYIPQSGTGAVNSAGVTLVPSPGPMARQSQPALPTAVLNFTIAFQSGNAASHAASVDFAMAAVER